MTNSDFNQNSENRPGSSSRQKDLNYRFLEARQIAESIEKKIKESSNQLSLLVSKLNEIQQVIRKPATSSPTARFANKQTRANSSQSDNQLSRYAQDLSEKWEKFRQIYNNQTLNSLNLNAEPECYGNIRHEFVNLVAQDHEKYRSKDTSIEPVQQVMDRIASFRKDKIIPIFFVHFDDILARRSISVEQRKEILNPLANCFDMYVHVPELQEPLNPKYEKWENEEQPADRIQVIRSPGFIDSTSSESLRKAIVG